MLQFLSWSCLFFASYENLALVSTDHITPSNFKFTLPTRSFDGALDKIKFAEFLLAQTPASSLHTWASGAHSPHPLLASRPSSDRTGMSDASLKAAGGAFLQMPLALGKAVDGIWARLEELQNQFTNAANVPKAAEMPVVILPGFGNDAGDYVTPLGQPEDTGLVAALERRGFEDITVLPLKRFEWARVAGGLLDGQFYRCEQTPYGKAYGWYIDRARDQIKAAKERSGSKVLVVAHSAGGWLARAVLGDGSTPWDDDEGTTSPDYVHALVTLGTPHFPPPELRSCATRGALEFVSTQFPGAFLSSLGVQYVTVAGDSVAGNDAPSGELEQGDEDLDALYSQRGEGSVERVAFMNYKTVLGDGTLRGDGVIPLVAAHLDGATQVTLPDVRHSFNEAGTTQLAKKWYGSDDAVVEWIKAVNVQLS